MEIYTQFIYRTQKLKEENLLTKRQKVSMIPVKSHDIYDSTFWSKFLQ